MSACQKLAIGGAPQAGVTEAEKRAALRYAQCMRAHGVSNFPDPVFRNGRIGISPGAGNNPSSPVFVLPLAGCGASSPQAAAAATPPFVYVANSKSDGGPGRLTSGAGGSLVDVNRRQVLHLVLCEA